jgi:hypothetical protein
MHLLFQVGVEDLGEHQYVDTHMRSLLIIHLSVSSVPPRMLQLLGHSTILVAYYMFIKDTP